jgi:hypothetical protein
MQTIPSVKVCPKIDRRPLYVDLVLILNVEYFNIFIWKINTIKMFGGDLWVGNDLFCWLLDTLR